MKMLAALLFVTVISFVSALPTAVEQNVKSEQLKDMLMTPALGERSGPLESVILDLLEQVRRLMVSGTDTIPPLDPLVVGRIHLDEETLPLPGSRITINDLIVRGISTFKVDDLQISLASFIPQRYRMTFALSIPIVDVETSSYDIFLNVFGGVVYGNGDMKLKIVNPKVEGNILMGIRITLNGIFLNIVDCRIGIGLDSFEPTITGMFGNEASSQFVSVFLRNLVSEILDFFEEDITNFISSAVMIVGNLILADLDIGSLLPLSTEFRYSDESLQLN